MLPSLSLIPVEATKSPGLMSARLFLTRVIMSTSGASVIDSDWPSRDLTVRLWPSSFSTVPRTRVGVPSGGAGVLHAPSVAVNRESKKNAALQAGSRQELDIIEPFHSAKIRW